MSIDWFTFTAQIVNFLILIWLLKKFLYGPVLEAIDEREKKISGRFLEAGQKEEAAAREREEFARKNEEFDGRRAALLAAAEDEARAKRQRMLDEARAESDGLRARLDENLAKERRDLERRIVSGIRAEVFSTARMALRDLSGADLEERMCDVFTSRLRSLGAEEKERVACALRSPSAEILVRSAFELPANRRAAIERAIEGAIGESRRPAYRTEPELVCGIDISVGGYRFVWSVSDYIESLEKSVGGFFD